MSVACQASAGLYARLTARGNGLTTRGQGYRTVKFGGVGLGASGALSARPCLSRRSPRDAAELRVTAAAAPGSSYVGRGRSDAAERVRCQAVMPQDAKKSSEGFGHTLYLGTLFALWYAFSVGFGVYNKQVLNVFPHPTTLTLLNLLVGTCIACTMWLTGAQEKPKVTKDMLIRIAPLAVVHTLGNLLTNISLGKVAVSFTHTIKSCEPFFSVVFSAIFLGDMPSVLLVLSLVPVVGGIALASFTEPSFNWVGLFAALGSNVTFTSRNVFSKKVMGSVKDSLDNINLFSIITIMSLFMCIPATLAIDGFQLTPAVIAGPVFGAVATKALLAGICFHSYQQVSYMVLQNVSPVTHSVGKCVKSVVVIVASIIVFQNPIGPLNAAGTALALFGVCCYSAVKIRDKKRKELAAQQINAATGA